MYQKKSKWKVGSNDKIEVLLMDSNIHIYNFLLVLYKLQKDKNINCKNIDYFKYIIII